MVSHVICFDQRSRYVSWVKRNPVYANCVLISLLNPLPDQRQENRQRFLTAYVDMIGQLSVRNHSLLWWATDISSKNRFFTPVVAFLEQFFKLIHVLEQAKADIVVCVDVPWQLQGTIQQALAQKKIKCSWHGNFMSPLAAMAQEPLVRCARIVRHIFYIIPRLMQAHRLFALVIAQAAEDPRAVYVLKTFASPRSFDPKGAYKDLFFGPLPDFLSARHRVIVLAEVMEDFPKTLDLMYEWAKGRIYPWEAFLTVGDVLYASFQMCGYRIRVPPRLNFGQWDVSDLIKRVCWTHGSKIQPLHFYQHAMMSRFLKYFKVQALALTCEFNPWEKMCLWAVQHNAPSAKTFGYQHTVVPQASANMFTSRFEQDLVPRPDVVVTVGQRPKDIIHRYETCRPSAIAVGCGLRFEYLFQQLPRKMEQRKHVLLALEGLPQVVQMVNYVLRQWPSCGGYQLRIRPHPVLPLHKLAHHLVQDPRQMPRLEISRGTSLQQDLEWADTIMYWGSAVALEAVSMGKPVIHFDDGSLLSYDPLFELTEFKWQVNVSTSLGQALHEISALKTKDHQSRQNLAKNYIAGYFHRVTPEAMQCFLERKD